MTEKMKQYANACRAYLSSLGIGDLRNFGREIGVSRPTAKKKEDLVEDIVGILTGELTPISISKQGAPVKNDRVDERIPAKIRQIELEYFPEEEKTELFDFEKELAQYRRDSDILTVSEGDGEKPSEAISVGQVCCQEGKYLLFPVNAGEVDQNVYIPLRFIDEGVREGDILECHLLDSYEGIRSVAKIRSVNGLSMEEIKNRPVFEDALAYLSEEKIALCSENPSPALKFVEWFAPLYKGQRGYVVGSPKTGKTQLLTALTLSAQRNRGIEVFALLVDQAPETVGAYRRILTESRLFYTTYEDDVDRQLFVAEFLLERTKRMVEQGKDVLLVVDSLSALAHAFNDTDRSLGGKTLPCGLEVKTIRFLKKFFGAARALEGGGSLTMLCALNGDTGNPFDEILENELSTQANFTLALSNDLAIRRIYPAIDFAKSLSKDGALADTLKSVSPTEILALIEQSDNKLAFMEKLKK